MKSLEVGASLVHRVLPGAGDTAAAIGNTGVQAVSTQALVGFLEQACHRLVAHAYEGNEGSVGTRVCVDHVAAAETGTPIEVEASLDRVDGRRLGFSVCLRQGGTVVMHGEHLRVVVDLGRFRARAASATSFEGEFVDFWFDLHSPWCWLSSLRIGDLARRRGLAVRWRPVHLPRLLARIGGRRPLQENAAFVDWYRTDLADHAELLGVTLRYHPRYPLRPARALRASLYAADQGCAEAYVQAVMRRYWSEEGDIEELSVLGAAGLEAGLDPGRVAEAATSQAFKARLAANLEEAVDAGLFGVPTVVHRGKRYFGNDRLELLERHLDGRRTPAD